MKFAHTGRRRSLRRARRDQRSGRHGVPVGCDSEVEEFSFAIFSKFTRRSDSDGPNGNIGFPAEPEAIDYFIDNLLKPTAQRLTKEDLGGLRKALMPAAIN